LRITEEYASNENRTTELALLKKISTISIPTVHNKVAQAIIPKSMVLDPRYLLWQPLDTKSNNNTNE